MLYSLNAIPIAAEMDRLLKWPFVDQVRWRYSRTMYATINCNCTSSLNEIERTIANQMCVHLFTLSSK